MNRTIDNSNGMRTINGMDLAMNDYNKDVIGPNEQSRSHTTTDHQTTTTRKRRSFTRYSFLAQIERQNDQLEKDLSVVYIQAGNGERYGHCSSLPSKGNNETLLPSALTCKVEDGDNGKHQAYQQLQTIDREFWQALIQDPIHLTKKTPHLLSVKLRSGTPSHVRGLIWQAISQSSSLHLETVYGKLSKDRSPHEAIILRDLTRTYPTIDMFKEENGPGQLALFRILVAYSLYDPHVGYCQGLAFLVGPLLMTMPESQAFCVFVRMMETYEMRSMFTLEMEGLQLRLYQFSCLLHDHLPTLAAHLDKHAIHPAMYAAQWFLTLFAYAYPMELVTRIYDILFIEGAPETMMRMAISLLQRSEHTILLEHEFEDLLDCVCSRKLCAPYENDWSCAIDDAMTFSNTITQRRLDELEENYAHVQQEEATKSDQVLINRTGKFWWHKSTKNRKVLERSISNISIAGGGSITGSRRYLGNTHVSSPTRNRIRSADGSHASPLLMPSSIAFRMELVTPQDSSRELSPDQLQRALNQLRKEHDRTIDELFETRVDKRDVETERDALKMTIMELERRNQAVSSIGYASTPGSVSSVGSADHQQLYLFGNGDTPENRSTSLSSLASCSDMTLGTTKARRNTTSSGSSSSDSTLFNFTPPTTTPSSLKNVSFGFCGGYDTSTDDSEGDALRTELVRIKVDNFETQQQCERLAQDVEDYQSRLDMANEGQLALVNKLVTLTSERDELLLNKKQYDDKWLDLVQENSRLTVQLQDYNTLKQKSTHEDRLMDRIYELEKSLAAAKVRLAEFEASKEEQPHGNTQYDGYSELTKTASKDTDATTIDGGDECGTVIDNRTKETKAVGDGPVERSTSLYGRMWHAISPRSQKIGPSC